ncbi:MAG: hypothetical protein HY810_01110 [Candidatus Omnitrophica bacterium]|nr:hypothetical protein [Candidatus Omnitrophota bacterium]
MNEKTIGRILYCLLAGAILAGFFKWNKSYEAAFEQGKQDILLESKRAYVKPEIYEYLTNIEKTAQYHGYNNGRNMFLVRQKIEEAQQKRKGQQVKNISEKEVSGASDLDIERIMKIVIPEKYFTVRQMSVSKEKAEVLLQASSNKNIDRYNLRAAKPAIYRSAFSDV